VSRLRKMAVTINDVAEKAGVSITTVSRVLNNNYPVKKETRVTVEKVIEELNYKPNAMARGLITKKTSTIGVVVPGITNLFFPTIVETFENEVRNCGYTISLCNTFGDPDEEKMLMENLISRQIDGMLIIDPTYENLKNKILDDISKSVPTIIVNGSGEGAESNFISYDERVGTREALEYLLHLNHKKIVFIRGARSYSYDIKQKVYDKIIQDNNLEYNNILSVSDGNSIKVVDIVEKQVTEILSKEIKPTAFFACNELMALGAINACNNLGLKIPESISIISCDNTILSKITSPKLTTIDLKIKDIGQIAAVTLIDIIETKFKGRRKINLDTELIIRDSCREI
jgi:LacI family transcriptional regulator